MDTMTTPMQTNVPPAVEREVAGSTCCVSAPAEGGTFQPSPGTRWIAKPSQRLGASGAPTDLVSPVIPISPDMRRILDPFPHRCQVLWVGHEGQGGWWIACFTSWAGVELLIDQLKTEADTSPGPDSEFAHEVADHLVKHMREVS